MGAAGIIDWRRDAGVTGTWAVRDVTRESGVMDIITAAPRAMRKRHTGGGPGAQRSDRGLGGCSPAVSFRARADTGTGGSAAEGTFTAMRGIAAGGMATLTSSGMDTATAGGMGVWCGCTFLR